MADEPTQRERSVGQDHSDEIVCTSLDRDWGDDQPNPLMHPPCGCPRCAPERVVVDERQWLRASGRRDRLRVETARLGETGRSVL